MSGMKPSLQVDEGAVVGSVGLGTESRRLELSPTGLETSLN
jgi:hypothetical protein